MAGITKYITWSGGPSGDYVCDGDHDEVQFQTAFNWANTNPGNTIKMRGSGDASNPHKYHIQAQFKICSNVVWTAEPGVCLFIPNGACGTSVSNCVFPNATPVIGQLGAYITNLEIYGFEIDGNCQNQSTVLGIVGGKPQSSGSGVERLIQLKGGSGSYTKSSNIYIHDMNTHDAFGEFVHISFATGVRIASSTASNHQHDCFYFAEVHGDNNEVTKCTFYGITDSTGRLDGCQNVTIHDNHFYSYDGANNNGAAKFGHNCLQIANNHADQYTLFTNNITIYNNYFQGKCLCGIWINDQKKKAGATAQNVHIHHNNFTNEVGWADWAWWSSGINIGPWGNGVLIENNLFDGCYANAIQATAVISSNATHTATVRNNDIINTMGYRAGSSAGPATQGYGIWNAVPTLLTIKALNNYMSGNLSGNYKGVTPISISEEPIEAVGPGGGTEIDDPDDPVTPTPSGPTPDWAYVPSTARILSTDFGYVKRADDDYLSYINGVPFEVVSFTPVGSKVVGESHSPSVEGTNLSDLNLEGSEIELSCIGHSIEEVDRVMAEFAKRGRSFLEIGGPFKGYFVSGLMPEHGSNYDISQGDIPGENYIYRVRYKTEYPYRESMNNTVRDRYVTGSCLFTSCDTHRGNLVRNPNFSSWTPNTRLDWKMVTRDAEDNEWQCVRYAPELMQWCAVAKSGTGNRIMVSGKQLMTDLSGDYHTGIYTGDVTPLSGGGLAFGEEGGYVDIPLPDIVGASEYTIYTRFSTSITGANQTVFGLGRSSSDTPLCAIWVDATGHAVFWHRDDTSTAVSVTGGIVADGLVHDVCLVKSGTTYILYIDNEEAAQSTATIGTTSVNSANIGRTPRPSSQFPFFGNIYSTRIYSRALASNEVVYAGVGTTGLLQAYASIITSEPGEFWAVPPSLHLIADKLLTGLVWCPDWLMWVAVSGSDCVVSPDGGVSWAIKSAPTSREWDNGIFIPANDSIPNGRLIIFAKSGTGAKTAYSDDKCETWTEVDLPSDALTNVVSSAAYSPTLHRVVAVCYSGSDTKRVIYTDDYGATYTSVTAPAQKWTGVVWADLLEMFAACSEDGTNQIITSPSGLEGTWTQRSTPYAYTDTSGTGTVVQTIVKQTKTGVEYPTISTSYDTSSNPIVTIAFPAMSSGNHYRLDSVGSSLKVATSGATAFLKVTAKTATISETLIREWPETSTTFQEKSYNGVFEGDTNEELIINYYLKSSTVSVKAVARDLSCEVSELTSGSSSITYYRNAWTGISYSRDLNLIMTVCKDTTIVNYVMYSSNGINYKKAISLASQAWKSIDYSNDQKAFLSVSESGTNRVQISESYGSLVNIPPATWTKVSDGQQASELHTHDSDFSLLLEGDGVTENPGEIYQKLPLDTLYDSNELYIMIGYGYVEGLTHGSFKIDLYAGGTIVKELVWDANTTKIIDKDIKFRFEQIPSTAYIRIRGVDTPNAGSKFYCGFVLISKMSDFESPDIGTDISTDGFWNCTPNVKLLGAGTVTVSETATRVIDDTDHEVYQTEEQAYTLIKTITLPALTGGSKYQFDSVSFRFKSNNVNAYVYCKTTIQAESLFSGVETPISEYSTNLIEYQTRKYNLSYDLVSATNEVVTLRVYIKISKVGSIGVLTDFYYKFTEALDAAVSTASPVYIYNTADTSRRLKICNRLPKGYLAEINKDGTGGLRYNETFEDDSYIETAYRITGVIARDATAQAIQMSASSSYEILFDTLYVAAGIPFIKLYVISGIPQISIAIDNDGSPGTYYSVDSNTSNSLEKTNIVRLLDNAESLALRGLNKFYIKIEPPSGQTCTFSQMLIYSALDTNDAQRISIYSEEKPNTIGVYVAESGKCSAVLSLSYRKTNILP